MEKTVPFVKVKGECVMRLDAHQHYWDIARGDLGWLSPDVPVLYRSYLPDDLKPELAKYRIDGTIVVQAERSHEETDYLLALSDNEPSIAGVVGWLDLHDPDWERHYERFRRHPKFVGFRVMIQEMADPAEVLKPNVIEALARMEELDQPVDLLMRSPQLPAVLELMEKVPNLRGVINHIAKPPIKDGILEPWAEQMRVLAGYPKLYCKLSGMITEADHRRWEPEQLIPYIRHVTELFGPRRVMFGSDWPVCLLAGSYDDVIGALERALPEAWTEREREALFGGNAAEFYKLGGRGNRER